MHRAPPLRGQDAPRSPRDGPVRVTPLETLLALSLCAVVLLASAAFLRRSSALSRKLADMQNESMELALRRSLRDGRPEVDARPQLVILISLDTLRADRLELYGYERETAPHLRALGEESVVFDFVCAQAAQTLISHKSMLTGKYPTTLLLEESGADLFQLATLHDPREFLVQGLSSVRGLLAAGFGSRGYRTAGFTDGAWMSREAGFERGFEQFDDSGGGLEHILPRALAWLETCAAEPAFLLLHAYDVHCPYPCREPFNSLFCSDHSAHLDLTAECGKGPMSELELSAADLQGISDHYDGGIASADDYLGGFFEELRRRGLWDRALIVLTSDHGESLGERGVVGHGGLYLEQLRVPLIIKFPTGTGPGPRRVGEPVELVDVLPTLFSLCSVPVPRDLDGRSLLPILYRGVKGRDFVMAQTTFEEGGGRGSDAARRTLLRPGRWQVINDVRESRASFYALDHDPGGLEPHEVRDQEVPALIGILTEEEGAALRLGLREEAPIEFTPDVERELEALGYAGAGSERATTLR